MPKPDEAGAALLGAAVGSGSSARMARAAAEILRPTGVTTEMTQLKV
jgi:hypothetical protein